MYCPGHERRPGPVHHRLRVAGNLSKNRLDYNARRSTDELKEELAAQGREKLKKLLKEAYDFEGTV